MLRITSAFCGLLLVACGGGDGEHHVHHEGGRHEGGHHEGGEHAGHHEGGHGDHAGHHGGEEGPHDHPELPDGVRAFHDVFAPIWHSDAGSERAQTACDAAPQLAELATTAEGDAPEGSSPSLAASIGGLVTACGDATNVEAVDGALTTAHDSFHALKDSLEGS